MQLWLSFPAPLCKFLGTFIDADEQLTWLNQAKGLTKCDITNATRRELQRYTSDERKRIKAQMQSTLNQDTLEGVVLLFKILGYDLRQLKEEGKQREWCYRRSMAETVVDYWPESPKLFFVNTFCVTHEELRSCQYSGSYDDFLPFRLLFCSNIFNQIMALPKREAVAMAKYRGLEVIGFGWVEVLGIEKIFQLIEHLDAKPEYGYRDDSKCDPNSKQCDCKFIKSEIVVTPSVLHKALKECNIKDIRIKFMKWIGAHFGGNWMPTNDEVERAFRDFNLMKQVVQERCPNKSKRVRISIYGKDHVMRQQRQKRWRK